VLKFSSASDKRRPEADHLKSAQRSDIKGVPRLLGWDNITDIARLREGLTFSKRRKLGKTWNTKAPDASGLS